MSQASRESSIEIPGAQKSPTDAVAALKAEFEGFVDKLREKLDDLEITMQTQQQTQQAADDYTSSRNTFGEADTISGSRSISRLFPIYDDPIMSKEVAKAQEPSALQEHRQNRQVRKDNTKYLPLGPMSSVQRQNELRLHNRWLQLSMQYDPYAAISELRTNIRSASPTQYVKARVSVGSLGPEREPAETKTRLHPNGARRIAWDLLSSFVLVMDTVLLPISLAWDLQKDTTDTPSWVNLGFFTFSLLFWTVDIFINLNTGVFHKGQLVFSKQLIFMQYMRTGLFLDVALVGLDCVTIANVLLDSAIVDLSFSRFARVVRIFRIIRLIKLAKVEGFIQEYAASTGRQWIIICAAIANSMFAIGLLNHVLACLWFWLGRTLASEGQSNWIAIAGAEQLTGFQQYLICFRRVMWPVVPAPISPESHFERLFDIGNNVLCILVLGIAIFKISATVLELLAMNEGRLKQRREIRRYLRSQKAPFELVSRVMKFVEYKLEKLQPNNYNTSLISATLQTELYVNQRSLFLQALPICRLAKEVFPEAFASLCVALKRMVCENREEIFIAGTITHRMYVTVAGTYLLQGIEGDCEESQLTGVNILEEFSLYMEAVPHNHTLAARTFGELFTLEGDDLVRSLHTSPGCAAMFFEYAKEYASMMPKEPGYLDRATQASLAERCCKMTRVYQEMFPDEKFRLDLLETEDPSGEPTEPSQPMGLARLIRSGWLEDLEESTLPHQLRSCLPELHPVHGSHIIFEQPQERDRSESSCISILALLADRYEIFTRPQDANYRLRRQQWEELQDIVSWARPSSDDIHAVLVLMAIRPLGKSKFVSSQVPNHERRPESAVLYLVENCQNVVPSVKDLPQQGLESLRATLRLHAVFNFAQMLQGENVPANVAQLQEQVRREGEQALRFYIIFLLGFMSGLGAGHGSRFLNAKRAENVIAAVRMLQHLLKATPRGIYWGYLIARAQALQAPFQTPEDLVLIRLACLMRIEDDSAYEQLKTSWSYLGPDEQLTLTNHFLAGGIEDLVCIFEFLPDCVANAVANPAVTLSCLLECLVDLLHVLQPNIDMMPDLKDAKVVLVDLSDMSEFIACVQNRFVFETCVSRCKIRFAGRRAQLEMTGGNWGRVNDTESDITTIAYSITDLRKRQQALANQVSRSMQKKEPRRRSLTFAI